MPHSDAYSGDGGLGALVCDSTATIRQAMQAIEASGASAAMLTEHNARFLGLVTDGDIRRALLRGAGLDDPVRPFVRVDPTTVGPHESRSAVLDIMRARSIRQVPVVDASGTLRAVHLLDQLLGKIPHANRAVILAGGRGTRLRPFTQQVPKPMLHVAGRPILDRLVTHLVGFGISHIYLSVGYLADLIEEHFGDGAGHGCTIEYLREEPEHPRGTGGPLALLQSAGLSAPLLVVNGDLVTGFDVDSLLGQHAQRGNAMTIAVRPYIHEVPFGVVGTDADGRLTSLEEKPSMTAMVSAGIYVLDPSTLQRIPPTGTYPITDLVEDLMQSGEQVGTWELVDDWTDVGRPEELARARGQHD